MPEVVYAVNCFLTDILLSYMVLVYFVELDYGFTDLYFPEGDVTGAVRPAYRREAKVRFAVRSGERVPHPKIMSDIYSATNGAVEPNDFYELGKLWKKRD